MAGPQTQRAKREWRQLIEKLAREGYLEIMPNGEDCRVNIMGMRAFSVLAHLTMAQRDSGEQILEATKGLYIPTLRKPSW